MQPAEGAPGWNRTDPIAAADVVIDAAAATAATAAVVVSGVCGAGLGVLQCPRSVSLPAQLDHIIRNRLNEGGHGSAPLIQGGPTATGTSKLG